MSTSSSAVDVRRFMASVDLQTGGSGVVLEREDDLGVSAEQCFDMGGRLIAAAQPDDSGRRPKQRGHVGKIRVLRNQREPIGLGIVPQRVIAGFRQTEQPNLTRAGKEVGQSLTEFEAEVLVEQQLHWAAVTSRRSRSAA